MSELLALGIDIGTSGVRAVVTNRLQQTVALSATSMAAPERNGDSSTQIADIWWQAVCYVLDELRSKIDFGRICALSVDGTSGTIVPLNKNGDPLAPALMYNDSSAKEAAIHIANVAPPETAAHGATSPLGRALSLQHITGIAHIAHQADWILAQFTGHFGLSDENNALKTGYDPVTRTWPEWISALGFDTRLLPTVQPVGTEVGTVISAIQKRFGFNQSTKVMSGTTDGCAAFLATGASEIGDGVTSLGTTLVIKFLSDKPIFAPQFGLYSHRIGDLWLAGGASNSGGAALLKFFSAAQMSALEPKMNVDHPTDLNYYPLLGTGERFPIYDPEMQSRVTPRPPDDAHFLQALLEGVAGVEALAYRRMADLGGPLLTQVYAVGGGAKNQSWTKIRERLLKVKMKNPVSEDAAVGAARLAWMGMGAQGL